MAPDITERTTCRACGSSELVEFISLGEQALANDFRHPTHAEPKVEFETYPLRAAVCADCCHSQLTHTVDRTKIFVDYPYRSGTSETLRTYFEQFADFIESVVPKGRVLDIGCNDGTQLLELQKRGWKCVGVDPCAEALAVARAAGIETHRGFWDNRIAEVLGEVDVIVAQNVLAHTDDVDAFIQACRKVLAPGGRLIVQTSQAMMIDHGQFDAIYHEHLSFFTTHSLRELVERHGLVIEHASTTPIHGISYVWVIAQADDVVVKPSVDEMLVWEVGRGLFEGDTYKRFAKKASDTIFQFRRTVESFRRDSVGGPVVGYGAAAKGIVLLQAAGIELAAIIDDCSTKWGTIAPGRVGKVVSPSYTTLLPPDREVMWVILAWNFYGEIFQKLTRERVHGGDRVVVVFPKFQRMIIQPEDTKLQLLKP